MMDSKHFLDIDRNREMCSSRFGGDEHEALVRRVARAMLDQDGHPYIVDTSVDDARFGDLTNIGLQLMYVLVCFLQGHKTYGEKTDSESCTFFEAREAVDKGIPSVAVLLGGDYPPRPPGLLPRSVMSRLFPEGQAYVDVRGETDPDVIASKIMKQVQVIRRRKQQAGKWRYDALCEGADLGVPRDVDAPAVEAALAQEEEHKKEKEVLARIKEKHDREEAVGELICDISNALSAAYEEAAAYSLPVGWSAEGRRLLERIDAGKALLASLKHRYQAGELSEESMEEIRKEIRRCGGRGRDAGVDAKAAKSGKA